MINAVGRELPEKVGSYVVKPYAGPQEVIEAEAPVASKRKPSKRAQGENKMLPDLKAAIVASGLKDGMTISFHHSFREGDKIIGQVLTAIRELGIKGLQFAPSAVVNIKNPSIVDFVKDGTINRIQASGIRGELGDAVVNGEVELEEPVILRPHGSRPHAIETGFLNIDVAFIGASAADEFGNCTGQIGPNACGALGYSFIDATSADKVVVITDNIVPYPCVPMSISQMYVDYVVKVDEIGDPKKIGAGATRMTKNPRDLLIAQRCADIMAASRLFKDGYSFQTGAGAIPVACTNFLADHTEKAGIQASFALGGMTGAIVDMHKRGLLRSMLCSQSFDAVAARAIAEDPTILEIDNSMYANMFNKSCALDKLNFGILGALEIDVDFNINILTGSSGEMMGGIGGGPDVAEGADISIVTLPIVRGRIPSVGNKVFTCCTPGSSVAVAVTEAGIALNPNHRNYQMIKEDLDAAGIKTVSIEYLRDLAYSMTGVPKEIETTDKVTCIVEYRDGTVIDVIRQIKKD